MKYSFLLSSRVLLCLTLFLTTSLTGCQSNDTQQDTQGESTMQASYNPWSRPFHTFLTKETALRTFAEIPEQHKTYTEDMVCVTFTCTVFEGFFCWLGPAYLQDPLPGELITRIITEIDPKRIEHAMNNEIQMRCTKPIDADEPLRCEVMLSGGTWVDYPLAE